MCIFKGGGRKLESVFVHRLIKQQQKPFIPSFIHSFIYSSIYPSVLSFANCSQSQLGDVKKEIQEVNWARKNQQTQVRFKPYKKYVFVFKQV